MFSCFLTGILGRNETERERDLKVDNVGYGGTVGT